MRGCLYKNTSRSRSQAFRITDRRASNLFSSSGRWRSLGGLEMVSSVATVTEARFGLHQQVMALATSRPTESSLHLSAKGGLYLLKQSGNRLRRAGSLTCCWSIDFPTECSTCSQDRSGGGFFEKCILLHQGLNAVHDLPCIGFRHGSLYSDALGLRNQLSRDVESDN